LDKNTWICNETDGRYVPIALPYFNDLKILKEKMEPNENIPLSRENSLIKSLKDLNENDNDMASEILLKDNGELKSGVPIFF
jgi:hypothetical protein